MEPKTKFDRDAIALLEAFEDSGLPAGHLRAFRAGALYGFVKAKREVVDIIDLRLEAPERRVESAEADIELTKLRHYVRNVLLWSAGDGFKENE